MTAADVRRVEVRAVAVNRLDRLALRTGLPVGQVLDGVNAELMAEGELPVSYDEMMEAVGREDARKDTARRTHEQA